MDIEIAPDIQSKMKKILPHLPFGHVNPARIVCVRSFGATSRARARIWNFPKIWQLALNKPAHYVIEILSEHFDHLSEDEKIFTLIHELMHIPKNFSGALVPHRGRYHRIDKHSVGRLLNLYKQSRK